MKTILLIAALSFFAPDSSAQERWTVQLNSAVLLSATKEDTVSNVVTVKSLKKGSLLVTYIPAQVAGERKRQLMIFDAADNELYSKETFNLAVPVASLKKWRLTSPSIKIYTLPVLGEAGAAVRLRRVHLCTINFE